MGLRLRMAAASVLLALVVGGALGLLLTTISDLRRSSSLANHSNAVLAAASQLERRVIDLETGERAFVITRKQGFLAPRTAALAVLPAQSAELERLVRDNPSQERRAHAIAASIRAYVSDYSRPLVAMVRRRPLSPAAALASVTAGKQRVDAIRDQFVHFDAAERSLEIARNASAHSNGHRAIVIGAAALGGSVLLVLAFALYLGAAVVVPVRRLAAITRRLQSGDLRARVAETGSDELGDLARGFNEMASALEEGRDELESQNAELELQTSELEDQQQRLQAALDELEAQQAELERSHDQLAAEKGRVERFYSFAERLAAETDTDEMARVVLDAFREAAAADVGALYLVQGSAGEPPRCVATFGLGPELVGRQLQPGEGIAGRAFEAGEIAAGAYGDEGLRLSSFGDRVPLRGELGVPIVLGAIPVGVAVLGRAANRAFDQEELATIGHLADQAAVALAHTRSYAERSRLARINSAVLEAVKDGMLLVGPDGQTLLENSSKARMVEELIPLGPGTTVWERKAGIAPHTTDPDAYLTALAALVANPDIEATDVYQLTSGHWIQRYTAPVHDAGGELIGRLVVVRDVSGEHEAERLARINGAVLDATRDGIMLAGADGTSEIANQAMQTMLGDVFAVDLPEGTVLERAKAFAAETVDPETYLRPLQAIEQDPSYEGEDEFQLRSGRWINRYTVPVRTGGAEPVGRLYVLRETTAERATEQLKSELVATVSHELRTPLASVLGFAELLVTRRLDAKTRTEYLQTIHDEALRLTSLVNNFLDLQRIEAGGFTLAIEPFNLGALLQRQAGLYSQQSPAHSIELELAGDGVIVAGDADRIGQVIGNLLSNAIKYSPEGGIVTVGTRTSEEVVRVSITDHGIGIPAAQQHKVFTKFFRADSTDTREIGGTGLGLALCREIIGSHGGSIGFESEQTRGSTFWFELPIGREARTTTRPNALVVAGDESVAALLTEHLAAAGCLVHTVASGEEALDMIQHDPPTLVCLDLELAGQLDGWAVLTTLKANRATARIPVIVCAARTNGRGKAAALGASDFLTKPFTRVQLLDALARVLPGGRGSVLVVDDEATVRRLIVETITELDVSSREAADGEAALAAIAQERPDVIVLDLVMPKLDGFAVLEQLARTPSLRSIPVIVLTGRRLTVAERTELRVKAVALLEKSRYSASELRLLIERALSQQLLDRSQQL